MKNMLTSFLYGIKKEFLVIKITIEIIEFFKTKNEAYIAGQKAYEDFINGGVAIRESTMTYAGYLDYWMKEYFEINYKYSTAKRYSESFKALKMILGSYKLNALTPFILNQALLRLYHESTTKEALRNYQKVIKSSLRDATYYFGFLKNDPASNLQIPRLISFELKKNDIKHIYSKDEIDKILKRFQKNLTFTCAFLTACYTGMRTGEVFALTWNDIDLDSRTIKINKTVYSKKKNEDGRWFLGTTKTVGSHRGVYICDTLFSILLEYKHEQDMNRKKYGRTYKNYSIKEVYNKYGRLVEYEIIESNSRRNRVDMVFTKKDGSYAGTDVIRYPFKIIRNELGIKELKLQKTIMYQVQTILMYLNLLKTV